MYLEKVKNECLEWLKAIVIGGIFVIAIRAFIFSPISVEGASMMPTYEDGDRIIVNKISKAINDYERFDVVVFKTAESTHYIKRIIGLPGDHIAYKDDQLYINGKKYEEPYLDQYKLQLTGDLELTYDFTLEEKTNLAQVPEGHYFVLGDNRRESNDSRNPSVGYIDENKILGKVSLTYYPLDHISLVE